MKRKVLSMLICTSMVVSQASMVTTLANSEITGGEFTQNTNGSTSVLSNDSTTKAAVSVVNATGSSVNMTTAAAVSILDSEGWLESANVEWNPVQNATGYNVYYKSASASNSEYKKLDNQLIRKYSSYYRADALGLAQGDYVMKIVPIVGNQEVTSSQVITKTLSVKANTREGFAFSSASEMGTGSGGYKDDGTVPSNAKILYITADTVNSIKADVVTDAKGTKTTTCTGLVDILAKRQKGYDKTPLIIRMVGKIKGSDITGLNNGYLQVKGCYNVTLEGVGEDATVYGWGILVRDAHNAEIRNLGIMMFPDDGISLDTDNKNIWVHNNDIFYGAAGSDADQVKGDGSCDVKLSDYVTVAYNHFYDSGKSSLCGMKDTADFHVTYHHNWFDHSDSRHPRIRVGTVHLYNNYFDGNAKYGVGVTKGSSAFVEANYFRNCKDPMLSSLQGTDIKDGAEGGFSGEAGGMIKAYNNKIEGATSLVYANQDSTQFDAYLARTRTEAVPNTYKTVSGGTTYNNFDTNESMYKYAPDSLENVKGLVTTYAGRVNGGDFKWNFTTVDDTDYGVNAKLMAKLKSYGSDSGGTTDGTETGGTTAGGDTTSGTETGGTTGGTTGTETTTGSSVSLGNLDSTGMYTNLINSEDSTFSRTVYVSSSGVANNAGTSVSPLDLATALQKVADGKSSVILLESGTYKFDKQITIGTSGKANVYNVLKACKGANVVFDFSGESYNTSDASLNARGIQLNGNYWYIANITIKGAADNGMMLSGSHNTIERCIFDGNKDTGLQVSRSSSSVTDFNAWPSNNYILNCTSKNNCDPATYENADGFAAKLTCGSGNVFDGCISYNNSDDGWDLYAKTETGSIGVVTIRNCIAMRNGMTEDGTTKPSCDGNGFKLGGSGVPTAHIVNNCLAIQNLHNGFTDNNNPSALQLSNLTAFDNNQGGGKNNFSIYRCKDASVSNSISYTTNGASDKFVNLSADHLVYSNSGKWYEVTNKQVMDTGSSTSRGTVISKGTTASDFINATVPAVKTDFDKLWRNSDGTLNTNGVGIVSGTSQFGTLGSDGVGLGARFSTNNKISTMKIDVGANTDTTDTGDSGAGGTGTGGTGTGGTETSGTGTGGAGTSGTGAGETASNPTPTGGTTTTSSSSSHRKHHSNTSSSSTSSTASDSNATSSTNTNATNIANTTVEVKNEWKQNTDGTWSVTNSNGQKAIGWLKDTSGLWYYLNDKGIMKTGWLKDTNGSWYYLNDNGSMKMGWIKDTDGKWYYLNASGDMAVNTIIDGYEVDNTGACIY